jgi:tetratricopeptide (TPR) repeat protein
MQYQEVIATAEPALQRALAEASGSGPPAHQVAELWSLLALSRQALGDEEGARSAFEEAIHAAPDADRPRYQQQQAALATTVGRRLLVRAEQIVESAGEERIGTLRQAMVWLGQGLAEMPQDGELKSACERARRGLWAAYGQTVTTLIQRQEFHRARRLIRDALAEEEFPEDRRGQFQEFLSATFTGEIGQLTASAVRALEDERDREALTFLQRAEEILNSVPTEALTAKRREEVNRRLWWGYTKLGMRRVEAGEHEEAVEPLFHALQIEEINPDRQQETREAIVRAVVGVVDKRAAAITRLVKEGKRSAALEESERLKSLIRESIELGLSQQELSPAFARARRALESLEQGAGG